jgi:hypothetical protein
VSSAGAAKQIAETYWRAIFAGTDVPVEQVLRRPLTAELRKGIWHVETTLPEGSIGVGFVAEICQSNGRVVTLTGYQ